MNLSRADICVLNVKRELIDNIQHTIYCGELRNRNKGEIIGSFQLNLRNDILDARSSSESLSENEQRVPNIGNISFNSEKKRPSSILANKLPQRSSSSGHLGRKLDSLPIVNKTASIDLGKISRKIPNDDRIVDNLLTDSFMSEYSKKSTDALKSDRSEKGTNSSQTSNRSANSTKYEELSSPNNFNINYDFKMKKNKFILEDKSSNEMEFEDGELQLNGLHQLSNYEQITKIINQENAEDDPIVHIGPNFSEEPQYLNENLQALHNPTLAEMNTEILRYSPRSPSNELFNEDNSSYHIQEHCIPSLVNFNRQGQLKKLNKKLSDYNVTAEKMSKTSNVNINVNQLKECKNSPNNSSTVPSLCNGGDNLEDTLNNMNKLNSSLKSVPSVIVESYDRIPTYKSNKNIQLQSLNKAEKAFSNKSKQCYQNRTAQTSIDSEFLRKISNAKNTKDKLHHLKDCGSLDDNYGVDIALGGDIISIRRKKKKQNPSYGIQENSFLTFIKGLPEKPPTTIRFFDRSDFYSVHGDDAIYTAKTFFKSTAGLKYLGSGKKTMPSICLGKAKFEAFIRELLLVRQYRVEVFENSAGTGAKCQNWKVTFKASPGNLTQFEDVLFGTKEMDSGAGVMAVRLSTKNNKRIIGMAIVDLTLKTFQVCQFSDSDKFGTLEAAVVQLSPKECVICPSEAEIKPIFERSNILINERKRAEFNPKHIEQDMNRLLKNQNDFLLPDIDRELILSCLSALISYLEILNQEENFQQFTLATVDLDQYMRLDSTAAKALNVLPENQGVQSDSLLGVLNECKTAMGQRLLNQWILQPLKDVQLIIERQNTVSVFVNNSLMRRTIREILATRVIDLVRVCGKFNRKKATLEDCYKIQQCVNRLSEIVTALEMDESEEGKREIQANFVGPLTELGCDLNKFDELITETLDLKAAEESREYFIKADFDSELEEQKGHLDEIRQDIENLLEEVAVKLKLEARKALKLETNSQYGYFFRVTRNNEKTIRNNKSCIIIETRKDGVKFRTGNLQDLSKEYDSSARKYKEMQKILVEKVLTVAAGYVDSLLNLAATLAKLDVLSTFAEVAVGAPIPYCCPEIFDSEEGIIDIKNLRHACVERQDDVAYIANDILMKRGEQMLVVITGPNMGGKSTYIKSVGVAVLLAQIGSFVPAESAKISVTDGILARVGAGDCQMKGVSTFMAEMLEISSILRCATKNSLLIIDELGRGTSTYDGFGLAWSIAEYIASKIDAYCLFATHFHELTALADEIKSVKNFHVAALCENETLTLLYQVQAGACDRSFGIDVARMTNFPERVLEVIVEAKLHLEDYSGSADDSEEIIKKRRIDRKGGEDKIEQLLRTLKANCNTHDDLKSSADDFKKALTESDNAYLKAVFKY
ncbi:DgyrCDS12512 [Dimorphilus gyrociliatus]|uniref:DgyrCDS12512 n=1 Tax=Dimorphilus gyrociliatus TaxID=2664684 RepID=A0A7I8W6N5_9ANNE|nr:DgyrCDS12512 [Dimorphilus gyrociliatus]